MGALYNKVKVNNPGHSFFNLSYDKKFDCDAGQLVPLTCKFMMPNDVFKFGNEIVARMNPLVAPVMHEVNIYTQYFFVPLRIMFGSMKSHTYPGPSGTQTVSEWEVNDHDFETFLTGGRTGYDTSVSLPFVDFSSYSNPIYNDNYVHSIEYDSDTSSFANSVLIPSGSTLERGILYYYYDSNDSKVVYYTTSTEGEVSNRAYYTPLYRNEVGSAVSLYSLWDYLEFPVGDAISDVNVSAFPFRAYNLVWNNFFRDQILMDEVDVINNVSLKNVCWNKDYFTSAYTDLQRGQSPALPLSNSLLPVVFNGSSIVPTGYVGGLKVSSDESSVSSSGEFLGVVKVSSDDFSDSSGFIDGVVDASGLFNVNDLRLAMRVQEWLEVNQRVGTHLNEFLQGHFGIGPHDETLQRPVYLGGSKSPVIISEVLQTSSTDSTSPQGNMAGHGISADRNYIGSYRAKEFGVLMGVMYIRPKSTYQQGVDRPWLYETKYDFPFPEFAHLGNQEIRQIEIYATPSSNTDDDGNPLIFGYTERYNELRSSQSKVCGGLRTTFDFWHLGRIFDDVPYYNADFVRCVPDKRIFAVQSEPGFVVNVGNILHSYRPLPLFGEPRT